MSYSPRIVYFVSMVDNSLPLFWFFRELKKSSVNFDVVFLHPKIPALKIQLENEGIKCHFISYISKAGISLVFFRAFILLLGLKPDVVHTHLFEASLIGLLAARLAGVKKTVHTRHHASYHHVYFPRAVKYDRFVNLLSDTVIATSSRISDILIEKEGCKSSKVKIIHHGFDLGRYSNVGSERVLDFRRRHSIPENKIYIGVVSRYTAWKGVQYIIPAFADLLSGDPRLHLVLANAHGDYSSEIRKLLSGLPAGTFTEIIFEPDAPALFASFDLFIHCPIDDHSEAFGQVYIEALAASVPSVFTHSGVSPEFIRHGHNALIADYQSSVSIRDSVLMILKDSVIASGLARNGLNDVNVFFGIEGMVEKTLDCYDIR